MNDDKQKLAEIAGKMLIGKYHRHVFLCTGDKCCPADVGAAAWEALKKELKDRNLSLSAGPNACYRTKVGCLRVCQGGPVAVVYPEGTWYQGRSARVRSRSTTRRRLSAGQRKSRPVPSAGWWRLLPMKWAATGRCPTGPSGTSSSAVAMPD